MPTKLKIYRIPIGGIFNDFYLRADVDELPSESPWISVDDFKGIPEGEWFIRYKDAHGDLLHGRCKVLHSPVTTLFSDMFIFGEYDPTVDTELAYMPIPD